MHKLCFFFVCLSLLFAFSYGKVRPYGARSIVLSSTNAGDIADYNFTMTLDTELPAGGVIEITFPFNQYIAGLGLPYGFKVYAPYPNQINATLDSSTAKTVICDVGYRAANESFTIEIQSVRNPSKVGGTGNFKVSSLVGTKIMDTNNNFGLIGIFESSTTLLSADIDFVSGDSQIAGEYTSYVMSLIPSVNLPANFDIKIIFPDVYDFSEVEATQCSEIGGLNVTVVCVTNQELKNVIVFQGFVNAVAQGTTIELQLQDILNPSYQMTTQTLSFWVREVGTNNTIQNAQGVPGLVIQPGSISSVKITNAVTNFPLYTSIDRELVLSFQPSNPFNVIQIGTSFPMIKTCTVINGLSQVDETTPIVCSPSSHVMVIKGQATYTPEDIYLKTVEIKFVATMPRRNYLTNKVEIYTYLDQGYIYKVDQDTNSSASQIQVKTLTSVVSVTSTLTVSSSVPLAATTLTLTINPNATYIAVPTVIIELSTSFTGVPSCTYTPLNSATATAVTCILNKGILTVTLNADIGFYTATSTSSPTITITGLYNPPLPKTYYVRYYVYSSASTIAESYLNTFTLNTNPIATISMLPLANLLDHVTFYALKFTTPNFLEDGFFLTAEPNKLSSRIDIAFNMRSTSSPTFAYDLGSGLDDYSDYPCELVGLDPSVFATAPRCILIQGPTSGVTTTSTSIIRVLDFNAVLAGTSLTINIPVVNSQLGSTAPIATVSTYTIKEYVPYLTSQKVITLATTTNTQGNAVTSGAVSISLTNSSVQAQSTLTFTFKANTNINAGSNSSIQIEYPSGYGITPGYITVSLDGTPVAADHLHFASIFNFFTIELVSNLAGGGASHTIIITNITTPNASLATGNTLIVRTLSSSTYADMITFTTPTISPGSSAAGLAMSITPDTFAYPYAAYEFNFTTTAYSPDTASIQIVFPASYAFDSYAECTQTLGLSDKDEDDEVTCSFSGNTLTVTQFAALIPGQNIQIDVFGITNPSSSISGQSFTVNILDSASNKIESLTLSATASTIVGPSFTSTTRDLNVSVARITPTNPLVDASFLMTIDPGYNLPKGAVMTINFDTAFSVLFTETVDVISCVAQGGLYSLTKCSVSGVQLTIKFGETSNASVPIDIHYFGLIRYPSASTTLTGFSTSITYKGVNIGSSSTFPTMKTTAAIVPLSDLSMDYYPRNEGEMANYLFTFNLTTTQLNSSMYFLIRFPNDYDPDLFQYTPVAESDDLIGYLNADVMSRQITVYGFENMTVTGPITLRLWGIVNPNKVDISSTGTFTVALMYGDDALEANFNIPGIVPLLAPDSIQFTYLNSTVYYSRYSNDFLFTFLSSKAILASSLGGEIFVDFPPDYLIDSYDGSCTINEDFSFFVSCTIDNNRIFVDASNPEWTELMGALNLTIENIRTPDDDGETHNFVVSNYDSLNKKVLSRSYSNLNPASLTYIYDGDLISVNDDEIVDVEVGTYTDEIIIKMPEASQQSLTLTPNVLNASILVIPSTLTITMGETQATFRVAVPRDMLLKTFYITWSKTGDSLDTTYANLRRTPLRLRSGWVKRVIQSEDMEYIPVAGITFPLLVYTNNPPYTGLIVTLFVRNSDTLATISTSTLTFGGGVYNQNYTIAVDASHALTYVEIGFSLGGTDGASFELPSSYIHIPIVAEETFLPQILSGSVVKTTRSTASFTITANTLSFIYYVIGYKGMPVPTFSNVSSQAVNQTLEYSDPIFGVTYIKRTPKTIDFTVSNLTPGRSYQIYAYVMNLNQVNNPAYLELDFATNEPQVAAEFILAIQQSTVASDVKSEIISRIAIMLSVDKARLIERTSDCVQTLDSINYHDANTTYFHLYLLPDPTNENEDATPLILVENLNTRTDEIREFIPRLAAGDLLQVQPLYPTIPSWTGGPSVADNDYTSLTFSVTVDTGCGYLYAVALPVLNSENTTATDATVYQYQAPATDIYPSSFQIYSGYDSNNQPAISSVMRINNYNQDYEFKISGLQDHLIYNVFLTTENDWPAYNEFLPDTKVARVETKTIKIRTPLNVFSKNMKNYAVDNSSYSPLTSQVSWISLFIALFFVWIA